MDTDFSSIVDAINRQNGTSSPVTPGATLSDRERMDNYNVFNDMMRKGVYLPDLIKRIDTMEAEIKTLKDAPKQSHAEEELFAVMEAAVRNNPEVKKARQRRADVKSVLIEEYCMNDPRYKGADDEYRTTVKSVYIHSKEQASDGS